MKHYTTIFLDWNRTLSYSRFWEQWQDVNHPYNYIFKNIQSTLFGDSSEMIDNWMRGEYTTEQIVEYLSEQIHQDYRFLLKEFIKSCQSMEYSSPHLSQLIKDIRKKGVNVLIATDNMDSFTRWTVPALQLDTLVNGILSSYDLKALKTDVDTEGESLFFTREISQIHVSKSSILMDDNRNIEPIIRKSNIDFLQVTEERDLERNLKQLINAYH